MRILSYMVIKNETDRYLRECLEELLPCVDNLLVHDDRSDDQEALLDLMRELDRPGLILSHDNPEVSFLQDESRLRQNAWSLMEQLFHPTEDDWVLTLDADEFLRAPYPEYLRETCEATARIGGNALQFHFYEIWTPIEESPMIRTDGFWQDTNGVRACAWRPGGQFKSQKMGGGSLPTYADRIVYQDEMDILHYGYARQEDREAKYQRYVAEKGHNPKHIASILKPPTLAPLPELGYSR